LFIRPHKGRWEKRGYEVSLLFTSSHYLILNIYKNNFRVPQDNETLFLNWQKEPWQTFEEASGYMRPERVNNWPNSMTDR
jgi:hypothetical protein